jgi:endonuclease/exonuclease/phosphatase family metal-dependent hydrolase
MEEHFGLSTRRSTVGVAVLSHLPLGPVRVRRMPSMRGVGEEAAGKCLQRQLIETSVGWPSDPSRRVSVLITHVEYHCIGDRRLQAQYLADRIRNTTGPLLVLGDTNLQPHTAEMQLIFDTGVQDATIAHGTHGPTEVVVGEGQVDYVLYRDLRLIEAHVADHRNASDHRPVVATFGLLD